MVDSIHVARWISQFEASDVEFTLFPSTPNRRVHSKIKKMMTANGNIKIVPFGGLLSIPLWGLDLVFSDYVRGFLLRRLIKKSSPDFVHALELQHGGYITSRALEDSSIKTPFIATNYGSDIYWFQQFPRHLLRLRATLKRADSYSCECVRDVKLAKELGFSGTVLPIIPNAGLEGFNSLGSSKTQMNVRDVILIKGYDNWVGRARIVLEALSYISTDLANYRLVIYSANIKTILWAKLVAPRRGLNFEVFGKNKLSHSEIRKLMIRARIHIAASLSDGLSTSSLEALTAGAVVVQTNTSCVGEWWVDDVNGFDIANLEPKNVANQIMRALEIGQNNFQQGAIEKLSSLKGLQKVFYNLTGGQNA